MYDGYGSNEGGGGVKRGRERSRTTLLQIREGWECGTYRVVEGRQVIAQVLSS
jgi:hypothetical protein